MPIIPPPPPPPLPVGFIQAVGDITVDGKEHRLAMLLTFESVEQLRRALNSDTVKLRADFGLSTGAERK